MKKIYERLLKLTAKMDESQTLDDLKITKLKKVLGDVILSGSEEFENINNKVYVLASKDTVTVADVLDLVKSLREIEAACVEGLNELVPVVSLLDECVQFWYCYEELPSKKLCECIGNIDSRLNSLQMGNDSAQLSLKTLMLAQGDSKDKLLALTLMCNRVEATIQYFLAGQYGWRRNIPMSKKLHKKLRLDTTRYTLRLVAEKMLLQ